MPEGFSPQPEPQPQPQPIYTPELESEREHLVLTPEQINSVRAITLGIEEVDETIREMAVEDSIQTLENGHPLNRVITGKEGVVTGYIACEDFTSGEAYIKYFGTTGETNRNLFREIPAFLEYAKQHGYTKLNFHGWNDRLNRVLEHFGFKRLRTDNMNEFSVDFYEISLKEEKSSEELSQERAQAFEKKYLQKLNQDYEATLKTFSEENRPKKEQEIEGAFQNLSRRLENTEGFDYGERQKLILKLKLARHFQNDDTLDINTIYDAIIETPKFLSSDKGSLFRLLEIHQEKTVQNIAEMRKERAEIKGSEQLNPFEALFETKSGNYYMARLLNMPHLKQESDYMRHCVGTSTSYINRIKNGDIEILSFRALPRVNPETGQLVGEDHPIITIEYNLRTNTIEQMKKSHDEYLKPKDPFFDDVLDALKQLRETQTDIGKPRKFKKISDSELENFQVSDYQLLTEQGEISFQDYDPDAGIFVLKMGKMPITPETPKTDIVKIVRIVEDIRIREDQIAQSKEEISENTTMYIGSLFLGIFNLTNLEHIYTSFPEGKIRRGEFVTCGKDGKTLLKDLEGRGTNLYGSAKSILQSSKFVVHKANEIVPTIRLKVSDLFPDGKTHTYDEIITRARELGLDDNLPHETASNILLNKSIQLNLGEWYSVTSKTITGRDDIPGVFLLERSDDGLCLSDGWAGPSSKWSPDHELLFGLRPKPEQSSV